MKSNEHKGSEHSSSSKGDGQSRGGKEAAGGGKTAAAGSRLPHSVFTLPSSRWNAVAAHFTSRYFSIGKSLQANMLRGRVLFLEMPMEGGGGD